jgi:hypothetical protein
MCYYSSSDDRCTVTVLNAKILISIVPYVERLLLCAPPPPLFGGEDTLAGPRGGWGVNILEDERHRIALNHDYF